MRTAIQIRPICNDKDHRAALAEIEKLWDASLNQYGLTPAVLQAKAAKLNIPALQMFECMISARVSWRRKRDVEAELPARRQKKVIVTRSRRIRLYGDRKATPS